MDDSGRVRITDFGLAAIPQDLARKRRFFDDRNVRWIASEILHDYGTYSKEADIFAFAMIMFEVRYGGIVVLSSGLLWFRPNVGFHWRSSV